MNEQQDRTRAGERRLQEALLSQAPAAGDHLTEEEMALIVLGEPGPHNARLDSHTAGCERCAAELMVLFQAYEATPEPQWGPRQDEFLARLRQEIRRPAEHPAVNVVEKVVRFLFPEKVVPGLTAAPQMLANAPRAIWLTENGTASVSLAQEGDRWVLTLGVGEGEAKEELVRIAVMEGNLVSDSWLAVLHEDLLLPGHRTARLTLQRPLPPKVKWQVDVIAPPDRSQYDQIREGVLAAADTEDRQAWVAWAKANKLPEEQAIDIQRLAGL